MNVSAHASRTILLAVLMAIAFGVGWRMRKGR
jgi:hypothetical protein